MKDSIIVLMLIPNMNQSISGACRECYEHYLQQKHTFKRKIQKTNEIRYINKNLAKPYSI